MTPTLKGRIVELAKKEDRSIMSICRIMLQEGCHRREKSVQNGGEDYAI